MSNIFVHPGEDILVQTGDNSFVRLSHKEVLGLIRHNGKKPRGGNPGGKLSRRVGLVARLVKKGEWTTGSKTSIPMAVDSMITEFMNSPNSESSNITENAVRGLLEIYGSDSVNDEQRDILRDIIANAESGRGECA